MIYPKYNGIYYHGKKLLKTKDINGNTPAVYMCVGNRTAGKSYFYKEFLLDNWLDDHNNEFMLIYRTRDELIDVANSFSQDIACDYTGIITDKSCHGGLYREIYYDGELCGYAVYLNSATKIKKISSLFIQVVNMLFDECIDENTAYLDREVQKLLSVYISVARGHGEQHRYVRLIMCGNNATVVNPYFTAMGIDINRIKEDTKIIRGDGVVLELAKNQNAEKALKESGIYKAFSGHTYLESSASNVGLYDEYGLIRKDVPPDCKIRCVIISELKPIGVFYNKYTVHFAYYKGNISQVKQYTIDRLYLSSTVPSLKSNMLFYRLLVESFRQGNVTFADLEIKKKMIDTIFKNVV